MNYIRVGISVSLLALVGVLALGCKKACDDLADVCGTCSGDYRSSCDYDHDICDILKGKAGNDCCEALVDQWDSLCN